MKIPPRLAGPDGREIHYATLSVSRSLNQLTSQLRWTSHDYRPDLINRVVKVVDGQSVRFTGYVEQLSGDSVDGFSYSGRSLPSTLLLIDAVGNELFKRSAVRTVAQALASRADITIAEAPSERVAKFRLQKGEDAGRALHRLAEAHRFAITDNGAGAVRLLRAPDKSSLTWVDRSGSLTRAIKAELDFGQWRNEWVCRGQREIVTGDIDAANGAQIGTSIATGSPRPTRRVLPNRSATSRADARKFVEWQAKKALAAAVRIVAIHNEWPGEVGARVRIKSAPLGIDEDFIIASLSLTVSSSAMEVTAACALPDAYAFKPLRKKVEARVSSWHEDIRKGNVRIL